MKRFLIGFVALVTLLAFFSSALAIDRTPKESKAKEKEKPAEFKEAEKKSAKPGEVNKVTAPEKKGEKAKTKTKKDAKVLKELSRPSKPAKRVIVREKYDYFIDKNNNGIDDRLEKKARKRVSKPAVRATPKQTEPAKPVPSIKEPEKKKDVKPAPEQQKVKKAKDIQKKKKR